MKTEKVTITTVDNVDLDYELAGLGSRFLAGVLDTFFMFIFLSIFSGLLNAASTTLVIFVVFALVWGYHIFFETLFQGQTPGKKLMGIQVVNHYGHLIGLRESMIRNLIRVVDSLPLPFYLLGGIVIGIDEKKQRLGDMAAGTIVVKKCSIHEGSSFGANWLTRIERGEMPQALKLPNGHIDSRRLSLIVNFIQRRHKIMRPKREELARKIAEPLLELFDLDPIKFLDSDKQGEKSEEIIEKIYELALSSQEEKTKEKLDLWQKFGKQVKFILRKGSQGLKNLSFDELSTLMQSYRQVVSDLARARAKKTDPNTLRELNNLSILGHQLFNRPFMNKTQKKRFSFFSDFPMFVRRYSKYMALSAFLFFTSAAIAFFAIQWHPDLAYDLVSEGFLDFQPWQEGNMHEIPSITRPVAASQIITNNIQVTFLAFAFGITAGIGTTYLLIHNGIHLGAVMSWLYLQGNGKAFWGWIMPHSGTEFLAIILAGGAGFILADAILRPGDRKRKSVLKFAATKALTIEIGCMFMLLIAGLIEGFISPSSIGFSVRVLWLICSCFLWATYFLYTHRKCV